MRVSRSLSLLFVAACSHPSSTGPCVANEDCGSGQVCADGSCRSLCTTDRDCPEGQACDGDTCGEQQSGLGPMISEVDGDGSPGGASFTAHRYDQRLFIRGSHLGGASVTLEAGPQSYPLEVCANTESEIQVQLPPGLPASAAAVTEYTLHVVNQAGSCAAQLSVLRGEVGPSGPSGPVGPSGPQGPSGPPGDPQVSIDGLAGGALTSGLFVDGTLQTTGDALIPGLLYAGGSTVGYARSPLVLMGVDPGPSSTGMVRFPTNFPQPPIFVAGVDETSDNSGPTWMRLLGGPYEDRVFLRADGATEAVHWLAVEPGDHLIGGKKVEAGRFVGADTLDSVSFLSSFPTTPVVLLFIDESVDNNGATGMRLNSVGPSSFQISNDGSADALMWIAMEPGSYTHGRFHWYAGTLNPNNCSNPCGFAFPPEAGFSRTPGVVSTILDTNDSGANFVRLRAVSRTGFSTYMYIAGGGGNSTEFLHYVAFEEQR